MQVQIRHRDWIWEALSPKLRVQSWSKQIWYQRFEWNDGQILKQIFNIYFFLFVPIYSPMVNDWTLVLTPVPKRFWSYLYPWKKIPVSSFLHESQEVGWGKVHITTSWGEFTLWRGITLSWNKIYPELQKKFDKTQPGVNFVQVKSWMQEPLWALSQTFEKLFGV